MTLTELLRIKLPIIQAPMAGVQDSALATAVSNAGGLGSLPCAMLTPDMLRAQLELLSSQTAHPYNVNFFCHIPPSPNALREAAWRATLAPFYAQYGIDPRSIAAGPGRSPLNAEAVQVLEVFRPAVVSFHFGLPEPALLARVKAWGAKVLASATTVAEALWLEARGADAVIAQGSEAGGHRGLFLFEPGDDAVGDWSPHLATQMGGLALLTEVVKAVRCPVIAAGGIADAQGVATAMALGAAGVQVGTAYLLCPEATTSMLHRAALKNESGAHARGTALTNLFTGRPARGIFNRVMYELGPIHTAVPPFPLATAGLAPLRAHAEATGRDDFTPLWAGQNARACREISAAQLTHELASGLGSRR